MKRRDTEARQLRASEMLRRDSGLTASQLAERLGVAHKTVATWAHQLGWKIGKAFDSDAYVAPANRRPRVARPYSKSGCRFYKRGGFQCDLTFPRREELCNYCQRFWRGL